MGYVEQRLWLDEPEAERDERIGEHEGFATLFDLANNRFLGNRVSWLDAMGEFLNAGREDPEWLREMLEKRLRVVARCRCDETLYAGETWEGAKQEVVRDRRGLVDFEATEKAALQAWREHVETERNSLDHRHAQTAKRRAAGWLVGVDEIGALDPMDRFGAIRTARAALDAVEAEAVTASRSAGRSWTEIGAQMGMTKQSARERFLKYDPRGAEAA